MIINGPGILVYYTHYHLFILGGMGVCGIQEGNWEIIHGKEHGKVREETTKGRYKRKLHGGMSIAIANVMYWGLIRVSKRHI